MRNSIFVIAMWWGIACQSGPQKPVAYAGDSIHMVTHAARPQGAEAIHAKLKAGNANFVSRFSFVNVVPTALIVITIKLYNQGVSSIQKLRCLPAWIRGCRLKLFLTRASGTCLCCRLPVTFR